MEAQTQKIRAKRTCTVALYGVGHGFLLNFFHRRVSVDAGGPGFEPRARIDPSGTRSGTCQGYLRFGDFTLTEEGLVRALSQRTSESVAQICVAYDMGSV